MANYNNSVKKKSFNTNRMPNEEYKTERAAQIARQAKSLDIIEDTAVCLEDFLKNSNNFKITMKEVLEYLNKEKGYNIEDTKIVSQLNYLMMELANARKNRFVTGARLNIRVVYIQERFKTTFKKELHDRIVDIINKYNVLFAWSDEDNGEDYEVVNKKA